MMTVQELLQKIRLNQDSFPASQRLVATFVLNNYNQIPFLTISKFARAVGTSDNTVIKFCESLGYQKYTEFKAVFSDYAHNELNMVQKISDSKEIGENTGFYAQAIQDNSASVYNTLNEPHNRDSLLKLVDAVNRAKNIYVTGGRNSGNLAAFLAGQLRYLGLCVHTVPDNSYYLDILASISPDDMLIAYSFPRYVKTTLESLKIARKRGAATAVITDAGLSPASPLADISFICSTETHSFLPCYTGCIALTDLICNAIASSRKECAVEYIKTLEQHLYEGKFFYNFPRR